ncbi:hypothetical protein M8C21_018837 [Ambrosia artemisiifolia]|uniref:ENT domain-containing protein n=1 Tax=Ambrosia artemisiifolia TaxID=4212 RepID=A0AAD5BMZ6_AMBAR|nr:hypothetical protein M8C21_018837 [Ambrosia artemisiifolia]
MDYEPYDSSGTDDDLPPSHQNRMPRGGHVAGNGRSAVMGSVQHPKMYGDTDMEAQIHQLERDAYSSVLRAFKAQADAITWEKEGLITELRKELRLSNEEHRELLLKVNSDDVIRRIREWRQSSGIQPGTVNTGQAVHDPLPSPSVSGNRKKQKMNPSGHSQSFGGPPQHVPLPTSSSAARRAPVTGPKGKSKKSMMGGLSSIKAQPSPSGATGRAQLGNRATSDYNPAPTLNIGRHALVYDMYTANETWEWVNLSEISPEDIQWVEAEDPGIPLKTGYGGPGHGIGRPVGRESGPGGGRGRGRGRGMPKGQTRKVFPPSQNGIGKKGLDDLQLYNTDTLIKEVERVFGSSHPDPLEIEKARKVLKEHEEALADAIAKLADISDGESGTIL